MFRSTIRANSESVARSVLLGWDRLSLKSRRLRVIVVTEESAVNGSLEGGELHLRCQGSLS